MTTARKDTVWQSAAVAQNFLEGVRGAIPLAAEQIDVMLRLIQKAQPQLQNFLDLGCGDGILGRAILSHYPDAEAVLLDFSEPMVDAARKRVQGKAVTFIVQDYGVREWVETVKPYAPFGAIVSGFSIHHQPDERKREIHEEIYDLLKPGGVFVNIEHVAPPDDWIESLFDEITIDSMFNLHQQQGSSKLRDEVEREWRGRADKAANILAPLELQCDWLRDIGFQHVDCYLKIFELAVFGGIRPHE